MKRTIENPLPEFIHDWFWDGISRGIGKENGEIFDGLVTGLFLLLIVSQAAGDTKL